MKLSVIIPAYNAEKFLKRAVLSIIEQNFNDLEIIVVNDGSTDKTNLVALNLSQEFSNIKVITHENQGVSASRNAGLRLAQGKYVCFLDADDYLEKGVLNEFYNLCEDNNLDVIRGAYKIYNLVDEKFIRHNAPSFPKVNQMISGIEFLNYSMQYHFNEVVPWLGLYKREYLKNNKISFPQGISYEEDQLMFLNTLLANGRFMQTDKYFITYVYHENACSKNLNFKKAEDVSFIVKEEIKLLKKYKLNKKAYKNAMKYISSSFYQLTSIYGRIDRDLRKKCVKLLPFKVRFKLMLHPYNSYHFKKFLLFNFCRKVLNRYYERNL